MDPNGLKLYLSLISNQKSYKPVSKQNISDKKIKSTDGQTDVRTEILYKYNDPHLTVANGTERHNGFKKTLATLDN